MSTSAAKPMPPREAHTLGALLRSSPWKPVVMADGAAGTAARPHTLTDAAAEQAFMASRAAAPAD